MKSLTTSLLVLLAVMAHSQAIITKWTRNTTGKKGTYWNNNGGNPITYTFTTSADSADVLAVAYNADSVWIRSNGLTDSMGKYLNPGSCLAQGYVFRFPRTPSVPTTKTTSPKGGAIGMLINGVPIFGLSNASSYNGSTNANNGSGIWNVEVGKSEGFVLDTNYGAHPQQQGAYHSHDKPYRLYKSSASGVHSPLIGYAFDGHPIYGPYGYSTAMDASSAVTRMKTGYSLRNITTRTRLPYNVVPTQTGPPVNGTYPLGTYCEDYEWLASNGGDLDSYNGRTCVTPEYPAGTYAYFVTIDAAGAAAFPYYIGIQYYGQPVTATLAAAASPNTAALTIPTTGVVYYTGGTPLPLRLLSVTGRAAGQGNRLEWKVAGSADGKLFTVLRSGDGTHFTELATVLPQRSTGEEAYTYYDQDPMTQAWYRVKLTASDGTVSYSSTVAVHREERQDFRVFPTLAVSELRVLSSAAQAADIKIINACGVVVQTGRMAAGASLTRLDISALPAGHYVVLMTGCGISRQGRFFKE